MSSQHKERLKSLARVLGTSLVLVVLIRVFLVASFWVASGSMSPTLQKGDFVLVSPLVYGTTIPGTTWRLPGLHGVEHGNIIVFEHPRVSASPLIKRVTGLPGDTLHMRAGQLFRNGKRMEEPYIEPQALEGRPRWASAMRWQYEFLIENDSIGPPRRPSTQNWGPLRVPQGHFFMLGDNRNRSRDSRFWGFVPRERITGEALWVYYSFEPTPQRSFRALGRARWQRIGEIK